MVCRTGARAPAASRLRAAATVKMAVCFARGGGLAAGRAPQGHSWYSARPGGRDAVRCTTRHGSRDEREVSSLERSYAPRIVCPDFRSLHRCALRQRHPLASSSSYSAPLASLSSVWPLHIVDHRELAWLSSASVSWLRVRLLGCWESARCATLWRVSDGRSDKTDDGRRV
jgi:hypothetical protein